MSVALLQPMGLLGLLALVVPLVLHLARRSEHAVVDFAALRWLAPRARPRRRMQLVERALLLLRLLLVAAMTLLLAEPVLVRDEAGGAWTLVAPGVDPGKLPADAGSRAAWRWLAPEFPAVDSPRPQGVVPVSSLLRELDARLPPSTPLTIWVPTGIEGLDGASIELGRRVTWRIADARAPAAPPQAAAATKRFAVRLDVDRRPAVPYLRAAWQAAWSVPGGAALPLDVAESAAVPRDVATALVWLRAGELPDPVQAWVRAGGTLLLEPRTAWRSGGAPTAPVWRGADGTAFAHAQRVGRGTVIRLDAPLDATHRPELGDGSFAHALRAMLNPRVQQPDRALARDVEPVVVRRDARAAAGFPDAGSALAPWLALLAALLFVAERFVASSARRWRTS